MGKCTTPANLGALDALSGKFVLITAGTVDVVLLGDEGLCPNGVGACTAGKALFVPLPGLVLHLFHACNHQVTLHDSHGLPHLL